MVVPVPDCVGVFDGVLEEEGNPGVCVGVCEGVCESVRVDVWLPVGV